MTPYQIRHCFLLFAALFAGEAWTPVVQVRGKRSLYARTRQVVLFDRIINEEFEIQP